MSEYNLGFIGAGNMASAIINGAIKQGALNTSDVHVFDVDVSKLEGLKSLGIKTYSSISELCKDSDIILLAIKPNVMNAVLSELKAFNKPIVSIAAGWSADMIKGVVGTDRKVLRLMPNTPLMAGGGYERFRDSQQFYR